MYLTPRSDCPEAGSAQRISPPRKVDRSPLPEASLRVEGRQIDETPVNGQTRLVSNNGHQENTEPGQTDSLTGTSGPSFIRSQAWRIGRPLGLVLVSAAITLLAPAAALVLLGLLIVAWAVLACLQLAAAARAQGKRHASVPAVQTDDAAMPIVSIHVPICNEPPQVVEATLEALARIDYPRYEVIVLDNNTTDPKLWTPVRSRCRLLGRNFQFWHLAKVKGFKAGALRECNRRMRPDAEFILVVDSDYIARPELLRRAMPYFLDPAVSHVQIPQAHRDAEPYAAGLNAEYAHFFDVFMNDAERCDCVLLTGTLSIVRREALEEAGGWSSRTLTEDAELGTRLVGGAWRGRYLHEELGAGVIPPDLHALRSQRRRWVFGNAQTLMALAFGVGVMRLNWAQRLSVVTQLTAWFNPLLPPAFILIVIAIAAGFGVVPDAVDIALATTAGGFIIAHLALKLLFFGIASRNAARSLRQTWGVYLSHLGLLWEGASAWIDAWTCGHLEFTRTEKILCLGSRTSLLPSIGSAILLFGAGVLLAAADLWFAAGSALILALACCSSLSLTRQLRAMRRHAAVIAPFRDAAPAPSISQERMHDSNPDKEVTAWSR